MFNQTLRRTFRRTILLGASGALGAALIAAGHAPASGAMRHDALGYKSAPASGMALVTTYRCNGCHGADLAGKPNFSPSLHRSGILKKYSLTTFVRVLMTGKTADGGHVRPPMPVYGSGGMMMHPGGPPPGGGGGMMHPGGMMHHGGGMHGPPPPPMKPGQAAAIYTYLKSLP